MTTGECIYCGATTHSMKLDGLVNLVLPPAEVCIKPECIAKESAIFEAHQRHEYLTKHPPESTMPELFKDTDTNRLGELKYTAEHWEPHGKGLLVHGATRRGKTRTAWYIANRLWLANAVRNRFIFLSMFELEAKLVASWGRDAWDKTMINMTTVPLLFLDDLGKERMTERMASCLFALIDQRTMNKKPTIITTNLTGDTLLERFHDKEIGAAFVSRLKDPDLFERVAVKSEN